MNKSLTLLVLATASGVFAADPHDPATELADLNIAPGYEVNLFASEKEGVIKPIQMRFGPDGRLWVCGSVIYPQLEPGQTANDKIVVLEDSNSDGRADRSHVFAEGLFVPTGLELGDGGVYVGQGTELLHLKDTDGDGRADQRRVVLRGFGTGDSHQTINSFTWGPAGEMMMCQGLHALSRVETPWGIEELHAAGVWRLRPRLLRMDPFLRKEMGPQNPFGVAFDSWGQPILLAGNGQGVYFLTPAMIRAQHFLTLPALWNKGRKFGGGDFVENSHFPADAQGLLVSGGYINNTVYRFRLTENGAGFKVDDLPPLISSTNTSFRVVDVRFGPDGALYLCDWYNPIIGHYQSSFRHPDRDRTHGRIWRVTAKDRPLVKRPKLDQLSLAELISQLRSDERWNRQMAKRLLADRPAAEVTAALADWTEKLNPADTDYERNLFEAVGVYESLEVAPAALLDKLSRARDYRARAYAARAMGHMHQQLPDVRTRLAAAAADAHPRVRMEAVVACSYLPHAEAVEIALIAADHPLDSFVDYALIQTIHTLKPVWWDPFRNGQLAFDGRANRLEFFVKADGSADTLSAVSDRLKAQSLPPATRESFLRILTEAGGPRELSAVLAPSSYFVNDLYNPGMHARLLQALSHVATVRKTRPIGDLAETLRPLLAAEPAELRAAAVQLVGAWKVNGLGPEMSSLALAEGTDLQVRRAAAIALGALGNSASGQLLVELSKARKFPTLQSAAVVGLLNVSNDVAAVQAASILSASSDESVVTEIVSAFLPRPGAIGPLVRELRLLPPTRRAAEVGLSIMNASGRRDAELARVLAEAAGQKNQSKPLSEEETRAFAAEVTRSGNPRLGADIYRRADLGCVACHAIDGVGASIGPDLGSLGTAQTVEFVIGALLYPNREVKEGFMSVEITTKQGDEYQGYQIRQDAEQVVLRDVLQQREVRVRRDNIRETKQHGSVMPAGLVDNLSSDEFRDLVSYLANLGKQKTGRPAAP